MASGGHGEAGAFPNPMHQFEIKRWYDLELFGVDASFTNSAVFMVAAVLLGSAFLIFSTRRHAIIPGRAQSISEITYEFIANMVRDNAGPAGIKYFPFIFSLFVFILLLNMLGMLPLGHYGFTVTSHIIVTFAMAAFVFLGITFIGFAKHGIGFLKLFVPSGVPIAMAAPLVVIEVISYLTRPLSLSVRLFANMMAGHALLKVFGAFVAALGIFGGWAPLLFMIPFTGLEIIVAFLQAYVFAILTCIYLNDALNLH